MEFSSLGYDLWYLIADRCDNLSRRILRQTATGFALLVKPRPIRYSSDGTEIKQGVLLSMMVAYSKSTSLRRWFGDSKLIISIETYRAAAIVGNLRFLRYLRKRQEFHELQIYIICYQAALHGRVNILNWMYSIFEFDFHIIRRVAEGAAVGAHVNILDWLEARDLVSSHESFADPCASAAVTGNFECVLWFWRRGLHRQFCNETAACGNLELLWWCVKNNFMSKQQIVEHCVLARYPKQPEREVIATLEEFYEPGLNYSDRVISRAFDLRSLCVVKWLHRKGFAWNARSISRAVGHTTPEIIRYCLKKGCLFLPDLVMNSAVSTMNRKVITWLRQPTDKHGNSLRAPFPWGSGRFPLSGFYPTFFQFLLEIGYPRSCWDDIFNTRVTGKRELGHEIAKKWILRNVYV